jgi:hypothetical protein
VRFKCAQDSDYLYMAYLHMDLGPSYRSCTILRVRLVDTRKVTLSPAPVLVLLAEKEFLGIFEAW